MDTYHNKRTLCALRALSGHRGGGQGGWRGAGQRITAWAERLEQDDLLGHRRGPYTPSS